MSRPQALYIADQCDDDKCYSRQSSGTRAGDDVEVLPACQQRRVHRLSSFPRGSRCRSPGEPPRHATSALRAPQLGDRVSHGYLLSTTPRTGWVSYTSTIDWIRPLLGSKLNTSAQSNDTREPSVRRQSYR